MKRKNNIFCLTGEYGTGYDVNGNVFYFDLEDYDRIKGYYWYRHEFGYIKGWVNGKQTMLHRFIMNTNSIKEIDHIDHTKADCRKRNLRLCSRQQNAYNQPLQKSNTSGYKGVDLHKSSGKYRARISAMGKRFELGYFNTPQEAYEEYCKASNLYHGGYGCVI